MIIECQNVSKQIRDFSASELLHDSVCFFTSFILPFYVNQETSVFVFARILFCFQLCFFPQYSFYLYIENIAEISFNRELVFLLDLLQTINLIRIVLNESHIFHWRLKLNQKRNLKMVLMKALKVLHWQLCSIQTQLNIVSLSSSFIVSPFYFLFAKNCVTLGRYTNENELLTYVLASSTRLQIIPYTIQLLCLSEYICSTNFFAISENCMQVRIW